MPQLPDMLEVDASMVLHMSLMDARIHEHEIRADLAEALGVGIECVVIDEISQQSRLY
jgi:ribosomal protein S24E